VSDTSTTDTPAAVPGRVIGVAISIPEPYGPELDAWRERLGDPMVHAIPSHVTLLPPTTVDDPLMGEIRSHLQAVAEVVPPFEMQLQGTATFRPVSPVVFVAIARGISGCERLEQRVRSGPLTRDLPFPYHPHVTVVHDLPDEVLDEAFHKLATYSASFTVSGFCLFEHVGGVWRPEHEFVLSGPPDDPAGA
jgi:2'-5' RNA ligase